MKPTALPKPIKSKNPVVILRAVIKAIKEEPKRYDQGTFFEKPDDTNGMERDPKDFPACGTICCVAGWVTTLKGKRRLGYWDHENVAADILGLEKHEAYDLFDPYASGVRARSTVTPRQHAADGIKHIKRFVLKKWGKKL